MSSQKTALITGAAARIGAAIAEVLHGRGCNLVLHYNASADAASALAARLNKVRPKSVRLASADLSQLDGVALLAEQATVALQGWGGGLHVLVNNASRFYPTKMGETRHYQWEDLLNSNLRGPYFLCQALLEPLRAAGGSIVNLSDIHARRPMRGHAVYCISKAGLEMMTRSLAAELGPEIRVNGVAPGAILWPDRGLDETVKQAIIDRTALRRRGEPEDVASAVVYLALDAPFVTGQVLAVDGGRLG